MSYQYLQGSDSDFLFDVKTEKLVQEVVDGLRPVKDIAVITYSLKKIKNSSVFYKKAFLSKNNTPTFHCPEDTIAHRVLWY